MSFLQLEKHLLWAKVWVFFLPFEVLIDLLVKLWDCQISTRREDGFSLHIERDRLKCEESINDLGWLPGALGTHRRVKSTSSIVLQPHPAGQQHLHLPPLGSHPGHVWG